MKDPSTVRSATKSTVTTDEYEVAIFMSLSRATRMLQVPSNAKSPAGVDSTASQSESGTLRNTDENASSWPRRNDTEQTEYAADRIFAHRG